MNIKKIVIPIALAIAVTGCSNLYDTNAGQEAIHYNGGIGDKQSFNECIGPQQKKTNINQGEKVYTYPARQITFKFDNTDDSDAKPIGVSTSDLEVQSRGVVTFDLTTDCTALQKFHEAIGIKYKAYTGDGVEALDGKDVSAGFVNMLNTYIKNPLEATMDAEGQDYSSLGLYNNEDGAAVKWTQAVTKNLPDAIQRLAGYDKAHPWFEHFSLLVQKPDVSNTTKAGLENQAAANARAATAATDIETAKQFGGIAQYQAYLQQQALIKAIADGKVQVIPIPAGGGVNITTK